MNSGNSKTSSRFVLQIKRSQSSMRFLPSTEYLMLKANAMSNASTRLGIGYKIKLPINHFYFIPSYVQGFESVKALFEHNMYGVSTDSNNMYTGRTITTYKMNARFRFHQSQLQLTFAYDLSLSENSTIRFSVSPNLMLYWQTQKHRYNQQVDIYSYKLVSWLTNPVEVEELVYTSEAETWVSDNTLYAGLQIGVTPLLKIKSHVLGIGVYTEISRVAWRILDDPIKLHANFPGHGGYRMFVPNMNGLSIGVQLTWQF